MKIKDILLEYDRSKTAEQMGGTIATAAERETQLRDQEPEQRVDAVLQKAEAADPTPNKKYVLWIVRQFVKNSLKYEDINEFLSQDIQQFHQLPKQRKQQLDIETDINKYTWQDIRNIADKITIDRDSETDTKNYKHTDDMKVLYSGDMGLLAVPETEAASCELGRGTKWCTATQSDNMFSRYNEKGPLYVWIPSEKMPEKKTSNKYQFHFPTVQFMDKNDKEIDPELINYFRTKHPVLKKLFAKGEKEISQSPMTAYSYAENVIRGRFPEGEEVIAQNPKIAYFYAKNIIRGRFPEAEEKIAQDPEFAFQYARDVIGGRWPEAEETIAQDSSWFYVIPIQYAANVIKGRWPEIEEGVAQTARASYNYATDVIGGRFLEGEKAIAQNRDQTDFKGKYEQEFGVDLDKEAGER